MVLTRLISKRLLSAAAGRDRLQSLTRTKEEIQFPQAKSAESPNLAGPDADTPGFFRRFLQRRKINSYPSLLNLSSGENLREKLKSIGVPGLGNDRLNLEILHPTFDKLMPTAEYSEVRVNLNVEDARKLLRFAQLEKVRRRLKSIPVNTITYNELVRTCGDVCGNEEMGSTLAKALDESGNVVVLGDIVFLHPSQVAKSMEKLINESTAFPGDSRREELSNLEQQKVQIDANAKTLVQRELYIGLSFLVLQTLGFMRLTFWELTWDVMEPICFFTTSFNFLLAYTFFLKTSKEPSFEGFFHRRFKVKQKKLMKIHNFDIHRYNQLREAFYPTMALP